MHSRNKIAVLTDGKAGHENQSRAFAAALGLEPVILPVAFKSRLSKALSYLLDRLGIRSPRLFSAFPSDLPCSPNEIAAVAGTGSGTFYAAKTLAAKLGVECAAILTPRGYSMRGFGCILSPSFDNPPKSGNIVEIPANLVAADKAFYGKRTAEFIERAKPSGRKAVAVVIGGPNKCSTMSAKWIAEKLDGIFDECRRDYAAAGGCDFWVTTSRRTPPDVEAVVASRPWNWALLYSKDTFNPVPAFVALADRLYVTAESTGMLSEACSSGSAEVRAIDNLRPGGHKFRRFLENLSRGGYVGGRRKIDISAQIRKAAELLGTGK